MIEGSSDDIKRNTAEKFGVFWRMNSLEIPAKLYVCREQREKGFVRVSD